MMKKIYSAPEMEVKTFDIADAILADSTMQIGKMTNTAESGQAANYEVVINSKW